MKKKGVMLRSSSAALLISLALSLFSYAGTADEKGYDGLVTGCASSAFFDTQELTRFFGHTYEIKPLMDIEKSVRAAVLAVMNGYSHIMLCLDLSEAAEYEPQLPQSMEELERGGASFEPVGGTIRLNGRGRALDAVERLKEYCDEKGAELTVLMMPLHSSRQDSIKFEDVRDYKRQLSKICDFYDFSYTSASCESGYFYTRDCAGAGICGIILSCLSGEETELFGQNFGVLVTRSNVNEVLKVQQEPVEYDGSLSENIPVLLYHHISESPSGSMEVSPETFERHLLALKDAGYSAVSAKDVLDFVYEGRALPGNPVMVTFDDGYMSNYEYAYPILKELGMKATIFVIGCSFGKDTYKDTEMAITPHFGLDQALEMQGSGVMEIQCHTYDMHGVLDGERPVALIQSDESEEAYMAELRADLEKYGSLGLPEVYALAYPKGQYDDISEKALKDLGIKMTFTTDADFKNTVLAGDESSLRVLCRLTVTENMTEDDVISYISERK